MQCVKSSRNIYFPAVLCVHVLLVAFCAVRFGITPTEIGLLAAGVLDWQFGSFDVYRVNPPLVRIWAAMPLVVFDDPHIPFHGTVADSRVRAEWSVIQNLLSMHGLRTERWLTISRLNCLIFPAIGIWVTYQWTRDISGASAARGACILWAFFPSLIAYGALISGDAQAASMGIAALYMLRRWITRPSMVASYSLGLVLGLTILTKFTWLILYPLIPLLWVSIRAVECWTHRTGRRCIVLQSTREGSMLMLSMAVSLFVINACYAFKGSFRPLGGYRFISRLLTGDDAWSANHSAGNRFRGTRLAGVPVPLPEDMLIGIDLQKWDFDRPRESYFRGHWRQYGWRHYYLLGMFVKYPLGFWILFGMAFWGWAFGESLRASWRDHLLLIVPSVVLVTVVSLEIGLNRHLRYVLPALPMAIVFTGRAFRVFDQDRPVAKTFVTVVTVWFVTSSAWIYPHSLSYFNESVGGPLQGSAYFNSSNVDWGQDLPYLRRWQAAHQSARPMWVETYLQQLINPAALGVANGGQVPERRSPHMSIVSAPEVSFSSGWLAIDRETLLRPQYHYLRDRKPAAFAGYGIMIYEVTEKQVDVPRSIGKPQSGK